MTNALTLGQQLVLSVNGAIPSDYQDPRHEQFNKEHSAAVSAAQLRLFLERSKATIRNQIVANISKGAAATDFVIVKVSSSAPCWDVLNEDILSSSIVPTPAKLAWSEFDGWLRDEGLALQILANSSEDTVRGWLELQVRAAVQL